VLIGNPVINFSGPQITQGAAFASFIAASHGVVVFRRTSRWNVVPVAGDSDIRSSPCPGACETRR
jgi:hypothetical protein